jgi:ketosteroid isomerase-like protein
MDEFYTAVDSGDREAHIALFAEDAIMMPNHWTLSRGKESIAGIIRAGEGYVFRLRDREIVDIDVRGAMAYTVNSYYYTYHAEGAEPQWHKTKNVHIWKRDAGGSWKLHVDIWNSDVPMSEFVNE